MLTMSMRRPASSLSMMPTIFMAVGLGVAGCTAAGVSAQITSIATAAQAESAKICQFVPDFAKVVAIVNGAVGDSGLLIGDAICAALGTPAPASAHRKLGPPVRPLNVTPG